MSNKDQNNGMSAGELLKRLRRNLEDEQKAESKLEAEQPEVTAEAEDKDQTAETAAEALATETVATETVAAETVAAETNGENDDDQQSQVAALMKKFLSPEEYEKFSRPRKTEVPTETPADVPTDVPADISAEQKPEAEEKSENEPAAEETAAPEIGDLPTDAVDEPEVVFDFSSAEDPDAAEAVDADVDAPAADDAAADVNEAIEAIEAIEATAEDPDAAEAVGTADGADTAEEITETYFAEDESEGAELDETDQKLMVAFGMEDELAQTVGFDKVNDIVSEAERSVEMPVKKEEDEPEEYTDPEQIKPIMRGYKKRYRFLLLRILGAAAIAVIAFLLENLPALGGTLPGALNPAAYPVVYTMAELQIVFFGIALVFPQLFEGWKQLRNGKPGPETITLGLSALAVLYHIVLAFIGAFAAAQLGSGLRIYNFPLTVAFLASVIYEYCDLKREVFSFNAITTKRPKFIISRLDDEASSLERETFAPYLPDDPSIYRIGKANFVENFMQRGRTQVSRRRIFKVLLPACGGLIVLFFIFGLIRGGFYEGLALGAAAASLIVPVCAYFTFSYPFYRASKEAYKAESAIIGESSLEEYMNASVISFDDKEVFPSYSVKVKSIKVFGSNRIDYVLYNAASLFAAVGGPLSDVFDVATRDLGHSDEVEVIRAVEGGLEAYISGVHVFAGRADFLEENGIEPAYEDDDAIMENDGDINIMYLVLGGEVAAKIYVQYFIDPDFEMTLKQLYRIGMCVGIRTFDPNIDEAMLSRHIRTAKYPVRVLRCHTLADASETVERAESGIVSKNSPKSLLAAFSLCEKVLNTMKLGVLLKILSAVIGTVIIALVALFGDPSSFSSMYASIYQLFWLIITVMVSRLCVGRIQ